MNDIRDLPRLDSNPATPFPRTCEALDYPNGLLAWGGDLHPSRLLAAYRLGIFPWYSQGQPLLWWSPAPRCVIFPDKVHLSRRTRRRYNSQVYQLTADAAFPLVIAACAEPRADGNGTWITQEMRQAYIRLFRLGHAHSLEVWQDEDLVGGIYGLAIGSVFFGESMFSRRTDASKIALVALCRHLHSRGYGLLDCQVGNPHLSSMGSQEIARKDFEALLGIFIEKAQPGGSWQGRFKADQRW